MKPRLPHILILSIFVLAIAFEAAAQDGGMQAVEIEDVDRYRDKIMLSPGEGDSRYILKSNPSTASPSKDTLATSPSTTTQSSNQQKFREKPAPTPKTPVQKQSKNSEKEEDDSILSFNFLYYIIQKYKLQDLVE